MVSSFRDDFYRRPNFATMGTEIPKYLRRRRPDWIEYPAIVAPADPGNPYGDPPRFHEVDPPAQNPYNDPDFSPFIVTESPSAKSADEATGGLPGMLQAIAQQEQVRSSDDSFPAFSNAANAIPDRNDGDQSGPAGRLFALNSAQNGYRPFPGQSWQAGSAASLRVPSAAPQSEGDQAQQAREMAAARLVRGVKSLTRAAAPAPDPIDIAKSAGIGVVNGAINTAGTVGDVLTGFGHFPKNVIPNMWRLSNELPLLPEDVPDYFKSWNADGWRHSLERHVGELYQPKTGSGRAAATIGEMVPALAAGEGLAAVRGAVKTSAMLRELPATLLKHAVVPGAVVHAMEEAYPDSNAGPALQKAYPWLRKGVPVALTAQRYLSRVAPK